MTSPDESGDRVAVAPEDPDSPGPSPEERAAGQPFEVAAARVLAIVLPLAEIARRRTDVSDPAAYVDDLLAGALLWVASRRAARGAPGGRALLAGAWGVLVGGGWYSVFGQLAETSARDVSGLPHGVVLAVKLVGYGVAVTGFVLTVRRSDRRAPAQRPD